MIKIGGSRSIPPQIVTYPGYGFQTINGDWRINVAGIAFQTPPFNLRQKMLIRMLTNVMKASDDDVRSATFKNRIWPFFVEADKGYTITVQIGSCRFQLKKKTRRNGRFSSSIRVDDSLCGQFSEETEGRCRLRYSLSVNHADAIPVDGCVDLLPRSGISVVSDIDDTIKVSTVCNRRELLLNTFVREFRTIDGMPEVYRNWRDAGADFHYVSSSPWQLFESLQQMQADSGLPTGTMHLRNFRLRDQFLQKLMVIRRKGKATEIKRLVKNMPHRKFVLVGDSGEKDPEIYQKICRRYPDQIKGLFIRELADSPLDFERTVRLKRAAGSNVCLVFTDPEELERRASDVFERYGKLAVANQA